jgi:nitroreductase
MDILETIAARRSVRDYEPDPLPVAELDALAAAATRVLRLGATPVRFDVVADGARVEEATTGILGDYGKVIKAPHWLVVTAREGPGWLVEAGYQIEQVVLEATARGLGTCWVGGLFKEPRMRRALALADEDRLVALTPIGHARAKKGLISRVMRMAVKSDDRKPVATLFSWEQPGQSLPEAVAADDRMARLFEAVRRAPSWANKQPWRFVVRPREIALFKEAKQVKEGKDYHLVDCGIAMAHLQLAGAALGVRGAWRLEDGPMPGAGPAALCVGRYVLDAATPAIG